MSTTITNLNIFINTLKDDLLSQIISDENKFNSFTNIENLNLDINKFKKIHIFLNIVRKTPQSIQKLNIEEFLNNYNEFLIAIKNYLSIQLDLYDINKLNLLLNNNNEITVENKLKISSKMISTQTTFTQIISMANEILENYEFIQLCINSKNIINEISETLSIDDIHLYFLKISTKFFKYIKNPSNEICSFISSMIDNKDDIDNSSYEKLNTISKGTVLSPNYSLHD